MASVIALVHYTLFVFIVLLCYQILYQVYVSAQDTGLSTASSDNITLTNSTTHPSNIVYPAPHRLPTGALVLIIISVVALTLACASYCVRRVVKRDGRGIYKSVSRTER